MTFIDHFSRYCWFYPLAAKSDVFSVFLHFKQQVENLFSKKRKYFQSDWGGEYRRLSQFFSKQGRIHRIACPYTHNQNGIAERKHRHIIETCLALLSHAQLPYKFWDDAASCAVHLINRLPTPILPRGTLLSIELLAILPERVKITSHQPRKCNASGQ